MCYFSLWQFYTTHHGGTVALQSEAVESGIVGYQAIPVPQGWSMFTVTFKDISASTFDLRNITPCDAAGIPLTSSKNKITIQVFDGVDGGFTTQYNYTTSSGKGWCQSDGTTQLTDDTTVKLPDAVAFIVNNGQGADVTFRVSGGVELNPVSSEIAMVGWSLIGNMTPVDVDLREIVPCSDNQGLTPLTSSKNKIYVQIFDRAEGGFSTQYNYTTTSGKGWCKSDGVTKLTDDTTYILKPGDAVIVNNGQGIPVYFKFPSPLGK